MTPADSTADTRKIRMDRIVAFAIDVIEMKKMLILTNFEYGDWKNKSWLMCRRLRDVASTC